MDTVVSTCTCTSGSNQVRINHDLRQGADFLFTFAPCSVGPVCSKQTGLGLWFWFQIGVTVSNKCIVCYNHGHHGTCNNQTLPRMI